MYYLRSSPGKLIIPSILILMLAGQAYPDDIINALSVRLINEEERTVTIADYRGFFRLVFFGYTHCPDICPVTLFNIAAALKLLKDPMGRIKVLFISVDPNEDSPQVLAIYTGAFHLDIIGLTAGYDKLLAVASGFHTTFGYTLQTHGKNMPVGKEESAGLPPEASYVPYHSSQLYLLDPSGELINVIGYGSIPDLIAEKIRAHLVH